MNIWVLLQGFTLGASMIIPIGAQNAYVLNQGIQRQHHYLTASICTLLDVFFISAGVFGGGRFLSGYPTLLTLITIGGIVFLSIYGSGALKSAISPQTGIESHHQSSPIMHQRITVIIGALSVSLLNPHVYLDTIVVLGSIGGQMNEADRLSFTIGSICASFTWFFMLSYTAAKMGNFLSRPLIRRCIDGVVAVTMFSIAFHLSLTILG